MRDTEQFLKACASRRHQEISRDYFIYHAFQYEFCLQAENSKRFVVITPWLAQQDSGAADFPSALRTMCDWYGQHYPTLCETQALTFARLYFFLPAVISFVHETHALWGKLHGAPPPVYDTQHDFWRELLAVVRDKYQHHGLLVAWLHWRYGERRAPAVAVENLPPNPFVERRTFGPPRGGERRDGRSRDRAGRKGGARREGAPHRSGGRNQDRPSRRGTATRHDDRGRVDSRPAAARHERGDSRVVAELTDAMSSEIKQAVVLLQSDDGRSGVTLKPANSYYRRLQHKMVANLGFTSVSVGDDRESRAVKIVRAAR